MTRALLTAGALVALAGVVVLAARVGDFLARAGAVTSTSGDHVLRAPDGSLAAYPEFAIGLEPGILALGLALCAAGLIVRARSVFPQSVE